MSVQNVNDRYIARRRDLSDRSQLADQNAQTRHATLSTDSVESFPFSELSLTEAARLIVHEWGRIEFETREFRPASVGLYVSERSILCLIPMFLTTRYLWST